MKVKYFFISITLVFCMLLTSLSLKAPVSAEEFYDETLVKTDEIETFEVKQDKPLKTTQDKLPENSIKEDSKSNDTTEKSMDTTEGTTASESGNITQEKGILKETNSKIPLEMSDRQAGHAQGATTYEVVGDKVVFTLNVEWSIVQYASETTTAGAKAEFCLKDHEGNLTGTPFSLTSTGNKRDKVTIAIDKSHFTSLFGFYKPYAEKSEIVLTKTPNGYFSKIYGAVQKIIYAGWYVDGKPAPITVERIWREGEILPNDTKLQLYNKNDVIMWDWNGSITNSDKNWQVMYPPEKASENLYCPIYKPDGSQNENLKVKDIQTYPRNGYKAIWGTWANDWQISSEYDGLSKSGIPQLPKQATVSINWLGVPAGMTLPEIKPALMRNEEVLPLEPQKIQSGAPQEIYTFSDLLIYDESGEEFDYRIKQIDLGEDWFVSISADGLSATIIYKDANISGTKKVGVNWLDREGNPFSGETKLPLKSDLILTGKIADKVVLSRQEAIKAPEQNPQGEWNYTFRYVPEQIDGKTVSYEISQKLPDGYVQVNKQTRQIRGADSDITFTNQYNAHRNQATGEDEEKPVIHVTKIWYGLEGLNQGEDAIGATSTLTIYQNDKKYQSKQGEFFSNPFEDPYEKNGSTPWHRMTISYAIGNKNGFEVFDTDGTRFKYRAVEEQVPKGYTVKYLNIYAEDKVTVSNTYDGSPRDITVTKCWKTNDDKLILQSERPAVDLVLKRNDVEVDRWQVPAKAKDEQLTHVFEKQKTYAPDGTLYEYSVVEENLPNDCTGSTVPTFTLEDAAGNPENKAFTLTNRKDVYYTIRHEFVSKTAGMTLPADFAQAQPQSVKVKLGEKYQPLPLEQTQVPVQGGTWVFDSWLPEEINDVTADTTIQGFWKFVQTTEPTETTEPVETTIVLEPTDSQNIKITQTKVTSSTETKTTAPKTGETDTMRCLSVLFLLLGMGLLSTTIYFKKKSKIN